MEAGREGRLGGLNSMLCLDEGLVGDYYRKAL
jgi:hypothetical protein